MRFLLRPLLLCSLLLPLGCGSQDSTVPDGGGNPSGTAGTGGAPAATGGATGAAGAAGMGGAAGSNAAGAGSGGTPGGGGATPGGGSGGTGLAGGAGGTSWGSAGSAGDPGGAGGADGGSAGSDGSGGTGGGASFSPCPSTGPCKILPLGDSITDGFGVPGGYRIKLFSLALADGKSITYVGNSTNGPDMVDGQPFPRKHEGHSGWTITQIDNIVPSPALDELPHIILLHIGTNDMYQMPMGAPERLAKLIDELLETAPDALLVVSTIIPLPNSASQVTSYNAAIPGIVEERAKAGKHILLVDQFKGFPTNELGDGVHPNEQGYARMAGVWYEAIKSYLP